MRISDWSSDVCSSDLQRGVMQAAGEIRSVTFGQRSGGEETDPAFSQFLAVALDVQVGRHRTVGNHQVQPLDCQVRKQTFEFVFAAGDEIGRASCRETVCKSV